jgi:hypothetical protein
MTKITRAPNSSLASSATRKAPSMPSEALPQTDES